MVFPVFRPHPIDNYTDILRIKADNNAAIGPIQFTPQCISLNEQLNAYKQDQFTHSCESNMHVSKRAISRAMINLSIWIDNNTSVYIPMNAALDRGE